jgi:hypothetical protein
MTASSTLTLRQSYDKSRQAVPKPAPPPPPAKREQIDLLSKYLGADVVVLFISGRSVEGKLSTIGRFDFEVLGADGVASHIMKHSVERIHGRTDCKHAGEAA